MSNATTTAMPTLPISGPRTAMQSPTTGPRCAVFPLARHVQAAVDQGVHPATHIPIHPDLAATCGNCMHSVLRTIADGEQRTRCELAVSRRGGPDILPGFPACTQYIPHPEGHNQ